ncbi:hypothetical protein [Virgibacillus sp. MSJ-26]|uniref:hypothetical protein n=1 Tax=Virgibacillus sp. MSJ-26 TaxID=2841522 RepID=UPI00209CF43D|nr:hypothetical protein [Virgibacillus sp. MSJ-26]
MQRLKHWEISPELKRRKKVTVTNKTDLPDQFKNSFTDGEYRTVVTNEPVTVYRAFGGDAASQGAFATTSPAKSRIDVKIDLALKPEWKK